MKKVAKKNKSLGQRIVWLFTKDGLPALISILVGAAIGYFLNGALGLVLATVAGFFVLKAFKKLPIRLSPWQALATDVCPVAAKLFFMMVILLPVSDALYLPTGQYPDTLTKYVSIIVALPENIYKGPTNSILPGIFPGFPIIVVIAIFLMVWGSMDMGKMKGWFLALLGLLLFTFSPSIASAIKGNPRILFSLSFFSYGWYLAWLGLILTLVSKILPRILKTAPLKTGRSAAMLNIIPLGVAIAFLSQRETVGFWQNLPLLRLFDFETLHHGIASGFSGAMAGIGAGAVIGESGEDYEQPETEEDFGGNEAPPPEEPPEPETPAPPQGPQPSTDPDDPPGTTVQHNADGTATKRLPDGTVGTQYTDGTEYWEGTHGETTTRYPDGTSKEYDPETGLTVTHPNGEMEITLPDGRTGGITQNGDGSTDIKSPLGGNLHIPKEGNPEGSLTMADGNTLTMNKDGTGSATIGDDKINIDKDGNPSGTLRTKEGDRITFKPDGSVDAQFNDGSRIINDENGLRAKFTDGTFINTDADGKLTSAHFKDKDGVTIDTTIDEKGMLHVKDDLGNSADVNKDGSGQMKDSNGSVSTQDSQGNVAFTNKDGTKLTANTDGTGYIADKKGNRLDIHKDGSMTTRDASGKTTDYTPEQWAQIKEQGMSGSGGIWDTIAGGH